MKMPELKTYDAITKRYNTEYDVHKTVTSSSVCCLADIPIMHLSYHAGRYGKIAIGFHRDTAIDHGFSPVFYQLEETAVLQAIYAGFAGLESMDSCELEATVEELSNELHEMVCGEGHLIRDDATWLVGAMEDQADVCSDSFDASKDKSFENLCIRKELQAKPGRHSL